MAPQGASAELAGLTGVWAAVKCLVSVGSRNVDLIKAHARCRSLPSIQPSPLLRVLQTHMTFLIFHSSLSMLSAPLQHFDRNDLSLWLVQLIMFSHRWIVRADPEAGLEMFTEMRPALPPETVLPILTNEVPTLCAPYLEAALEMGLASPAKFHNELALIYLRMAKERRDSNGSASTSGGQDEPGVSCHVSFVMCSANPDM